MAETSERATAPVLAVFRGIYALCLVLIGGILALGGGWLVVLGGSPYYLVAGLAAAIAGAALFRGHWKGAAITYLGLMAVTLAWALWESGLNGWALAPRVLAPAVMGLPLLVAAFRRGSRGGRIAAAAAVVVAVALVIAVQSASHYQPAVFSGRSDANGQAAPAGGDWAAFAPAGNHFSPLEQITPANVGKLKMAWSTEIGPVPRVAAEQNQSVPLKVGDHLYTCLPFAKVYDLDPETGKVRWSYDSKPNPAGLYKANCRGMAYYAVPRMSGACAQRLYAAAADARLIALDALTGKPCQDFGNAGIVDLLHGIHQPTPGYYSPTSAPTLIRGKLVVNAYVSDGQMVGEPSGVIRAYDAVTGKLAWAWDLGRPGQYGEPPAGQFYTPSTPNSWGPTSGDETLGLVYIPMGNSTPDYWGRYRSAESNKYASSLVALDAETGEPRWHFQTVHYDLWDYDVGSQPILFDLRTAAGVIPAVIVPTKRGQLFILDRRDGKPLFPVEEKPAPQAGGVEKLSPTQPWSIALPNLGGPLLTEGMMWGITPLDQLWCRIKFREARYQGSMTPTGLTYAIQDPGYAGGVEWGSASVDEGRQLAFILSNRMVNRNRLLPRDHPLARNLRPNPHAPNGGLVPQWGTPYAADIKAFLSPLNVPCQQPPWGLINAVDLTTGKMLWSRPIGSGRDFGPLGIPSHLPIDIGIFTFGGALGTRSGVVFAAASQDHAFRAYDATTGWLLFESDLVGSGSSTPISYRSHSGRQFVVISSDILGDKRSGYHAAVTAYALPER